MHLIVLSFQEEGAEVAYEEKLVNRMFIHAVYKGLRLCQEAEYTLLMR